MEALVTECFGRLQDFIKLMDGDVVGDSRKDPDATIGVLESFQQAMNDKVATEINRLKRPRDRSPINHKLPNELLLKILLQSVDLFDWSLEEIKSIALVSTHWFEIVHTNCAFWPELSLHSPRNVLDIVIKQNPSGLLRVRCELGDSRVELSAMEEFMGLAAQHACRWETLWFAGPINETLRGYLCTSAPLLQDVLIDQTGDSSFEGTFTLLEGASLRHLNLEYIGLAWNTSCLSNLKTLRLCVLFQELPSLSQIHAILCASPELERFSLDALHHMPSELPNKDERRPTINLPYLSTLQIRRVPDEVSRYLLSTIDAPTCQSLTVLDLTQFPQSSYFNLQFGRTLTSVIQASGHTRVTWDFHFGAMTLQSEPLPQVYHRRFYRCNRPAGFEVHIPLPRGGDRWDQIAEILSDISISSVPISVIVRGSITPEPQAQSRIEKEERIRRRRVAPWRSAVSLVIEYDWLLEDLTNQHPDGEGRLEWLCPQLRTLSVQILWHPDPVLLARRIMAFAIRRHGGGDDGSDWPVPLQRLEVPSKVGSIIRKALVFRNVEIVDLRD